MTPERYREVSAVIDKLAAAHPEGTPEYASMPPHIVENRDYLMSLGYSLEELLEVCARKLGLTEVAAAVFVTIVTGLEYTGDN
jgi:hypothetical protein